MKQKTEFFDMEIETISKDTSLQEIVRDSNTSDAHLVKVKNPNLGQVEALTQEGFFYRPTKIRYFLDTSNIGSLDDYLESLKSKTRSEFRGIQRNIEKKFDFACENHRTLFLNQFVALYEKMINGMKRGRNPLRERHLSNDGLNEFYNEGRIGFYLLGEEGVVAGIIVRNFNDETAPLFDSKGIYFSVSYFAFDKNLRNGPDLENYLMVRALEYAMHQRPQDKTFGCGMDTNLYGHHLSLGIMPFKRHFGFKPEADESRGRELVKFDKFDIFDNGAFLFFEYGGDKLSPVLATEELDSVEPLNRFVNRGESLRLYKIKEGKLVPNSIYCREGRSIIIV